LSTITASTPSASSKARRSWKPRTSIASPAKERTSATPSSPPRSVRRRALLRLGGPGLVTAALPRRAAAETRGDRPLSIVVILSDNHRADAMGYAGHPFVRTPALDRLARQGVTFGDAFCTTPLCSPARASFLTGLYAWKHGVRNNSGGSGWSGRHPTLLGLLKDRAGYATAFIGKWHMPASGLPALRGVDHMVTFTINDGQGNYEDCPLVVDGVAEASRTPYLTDELTDRALAWIDRQGDAPFCLYLAHKAAHYPWRPADDLAGIYADQPVTLPPGATIWTGFVDGQIWGGFDRPIPSAYRAYMETVTSMDRAIGRLLDHVDARGLGRDTVVVYASDNGFLFGEHGKVELRWPFEEVLRIPWIVRAPRHVDRPSRRAAQMALDIDLAPTLLDLAGVEAPAEMQGMSLLPALRDPTAPGRTAWLVEHWQEFPYRTPTYAGVRTPRWLYVEYEGRFRPTLHDLSRDPRQQRDLYGSPEGQAVVGELARLLAALRAGQRFDG
jgi:N-acetylglucosamine-6-sulfatase